MAVGVEKDVGKGIIGAMARADLLDSSPSQVQDNIHLFTGLSRQDRSHLIIKHVAICAQRMKTKRRSYHLRPLGQAEAAGVDIVVLNLLCCSRENHNPHVVLSTINLNGCLERHQVAVDPPEEVLEGSQYVRLEGSP